MYSKEKQIPVPKANLGTLIICWQSHQTQPSPDKTQKNPNPVKSSDLNVPVKPTPAFTHK